MPLTLPPDRARRAPAAGSAAVRARRARRVACALAAAAALVAPAGAAAADSAPPDAAPDAAQRADGDAARAAAIAGASAAAAAGIAAAARTLAPDRCVVCGPAPLDLAARAELRWTHAGRARLASDVLADGVVPLAAAADAVRASGWSRRAVEDVLLVAEAASISAVADEAAKVAFARPRPGVAGDVAPGGAQTQSFWSGHTALAFSVAVAKATEDTLRGDPGAPWAWGVGLALAGGVGYLRIAGDAHWATDVLAGAVAGSAAGALVPILSRRLGPGVALSPAPGGLALRF